MNLESTKAEPDLYAYDGARSGQRSHDDTNQSHEHGKSCKDSKIHNWHPDYSLSSPQARQWHKENEQSRHQPLKLNEADGTYTVQHGDCLSTIAARELDAAGRPVDKKSVAHQVEKLIALNHKDHPELDCNNEFLEAGWKLRLPGCKPSSQPPEAAVTAQTQTPLRIDQQAEDPARNLTSAQLDTGAPQSTASGQDLQGIVRLAKDMLQGDSRDAALVLQGMIGRSDAASSIQQADQLADQAAKQKGANSPMLVGVREDGDVAIVDEQGRAIVHVGNIYGNGAGQGTRIAQPASETADPALNANLSNNRNAIDASGTDV